MELIQIEDSQFLLYQRGGRQRMGTTDMKLFDMTKKVSDINSNTGLKATSSNTGLKVACKLMEQKLECL